MARNMNQDQQFNCIFCQEIFDDKEAFQIHFRKHADPNFNSNKTKGNVKNDNQVSTETPKKDVEMVGCDVCSEMFTSISKAITHKHKVHPDHDTKYFCPWCGKLFTLKHLYNKHLETNHSNRERTDDTSFHCDCCDVDFWVPAAMMYHNKFFHRQDTDIPAFGQSKKLKTYNQEAIQIYYCSFCGEEFENKVNLHKHTIDDHSDENQSPDDVLRCPLCDAIFYHLDAYELHLTFHSTEDLYSEKNELMNEITEFSLESVPPIMEKVENCEPQQDVETTMNDVGIDRFLEVAMEEPNVEIKKSKKHKKHKKSKKSAITLDEFLNMNTDVFGEGLDFQGIEEVPTQAITKRLKVYKNQAKNLSKSNPELEKLRKQGIVIKKKPGRKLLQSNKTIPPKSLPTTKLGTSDEVLSKLLSQSNNQIKIVKKSSQQNKNEVVSEESDMIEEKEPKSPETNDMECDTTKKELGIFPQKSEIDNIIDESKDKATVTTQQDYSDVSDKNTSQDSQDTSDTKSDCLSPNEDTKTSKKVGDNFVSKNENNIDKNDEASNCSEGSDKDTTIVASSVQSPNSERKKNSNPIDTLLNTGNITIKTASSNIKDTTEIPHSSKSNVDDIDSNYDEHHDVIEESTKTNVDKENDASNSSLSAFKHLSHLLTIKPVNESKNSPQIEAERDETRHSKVSPVNLNVKTGDAEDSTVTSTQVTKETKIGKRISQENELKLDSLKNLGINITVKSSTQSPKSDIPPSEFDDRKIDDNITDKMLNVASQNKSSITTNVSSGKVSSLSSANSTKLKKQPNQSPNIIGNRSTATKIIEPSANILKHLTNITAKSISTKNVASRVTSSMQSKNTISKVIQESTEIFNIDDSDSDEMDSDLEKNKVNETQTVSALKNISKNVTVKPVNQFGKQMNKVHNLPLDSTSQDENRTNINESNSYNRSREQVTKSVITKCVTETVDKEKSAAIKNVLKNLGKNITIQSRTSSPSLSLKAQDQSSQDSKIGHHDDDSDSDSGKVKITELENDNSIDDDIKNNEACINALVQSPNSSCSDNEVNTEGNFNDENEEDSDIETRIKVNTLQKADNSSTSMKNAACLNNLKNISKNITIKSLNESSVDKEDSMSKLYTTPEIAKNLGRQISIKPTRQVKKDVNNISNRNVGHSSNEVLTNQNMSTTSNQMNSVNKEVTVKTFQTQTKTVIQEITTTVTKTIKTVNQASKQEMRNVTQSSSSVMQQKTQGIRPYQQPQNLQGITVKNTIPNLGTKIRNSTPNRPAIGTNVRAPNQVVPVRAANQLVPMRPRSNVARLSSPRVATQRVRPSIPNQLQANTERPLKVSPNAILSSVMKRPSEDNTGPFSCFKKPKESLIPVSDVPSISDNGGELRAEYSASHVSKSNFTSTTKTVKGGSVVTSTQTKSEMSASSQQLSKQGNKSGLRVVKANQTQESSEVSTSNRTLEAIQKLQKQGLLVKKPRLEVSEHLERFDPGGEDNVDCSSTEENDD